MQCLFQQPVSTLRISYSLPCSIYWLQRLARHKGMGSLPSATTTACCARTEELLGRELDGIAQYNPASATMVSRTFSTVFIGGVSLRAFLRVAKYMPGPCFVGSEILMDNSDFLMVSAAAEWSARRGKRPNLTRSHRGVNERQKWVAFCRLQRAMCSCYWSRNARMRSRSRKASVPPLAVVEKAPQRFP